MQTLKMLTAVFFICGLGAALRADDTVTLTDGSVIKGQVLEETSDHVTLMDHGLKRTLDRSLVANVEFNSGAPAAPAASVGVSASIAGGAAGGAGSVGVSANVGVSSGQPTAANDGGPGNTVPVAPPSPADSQAQDPGQPQGQPQDQGMAPSDQGGTVVPVGASAEQVDYAQGVSAYYGAPEYVVWGYEQQGIPYEELPVIFYIAARAHCDPGLVVNMRLQGFSFHDICWHFGLAPGIFYWRDIYGVNLGGPYEGVYFRFGRYPHSLWVWDNIALTDADIIASVNLRFTTHYWHRSPYEVAHAYVPGRPYYGVWGGYRQRFGAGYAYRSNPGPSPYGEHVNWGLRRGGAYSGVAGSSGPGGPGVRGNGVVRQQGGPSGPGGYGARNGAVGPGPQGRTNGNGAYGQSRRAQGGHGQSRPRHRNSSRPSAGGPSAGAAGAGSGGPAGGTSSGHGPVQGGGPGHGPGGN